MTPSPPTIAESFAQFVATLDYASIPAAVRTQAALHLLDSVGIAFASASFEFARTACAGLGAAGSGEHTVIGMSAKLALRDAVLMNGMLVHGLEYDDTAIRARLHPSAFAVACALGTGAFVKATGAEVLTAYIAGVECALRIGTATRGGFSPAGFNAVGIVGAFGSVLISGKLLRLDPARLTLAQGIVYSTAAGNREFTTADSWTKRLEAGWPGVGAITAALLAQQGFIAPRTPYEGKFGVFNTYLKAPPAAADLVAITSGLGQHWEFSQTMIKMLPACYFNHPVINAVLSLVTQHDLQARDIRGIRVFLPQAAVDTVCEPRDKKLVPRDIAAAQFSVYFCVACAALRRRFTLEEMNTETLADPAILALAAKIDYAPDPQSTFPAHYSGGVEITPADGRRLTAREDVNLGTPERPLTASAVEEKFLTNAQRVMPRARAESIRDLLLTMESCADINSITTRLGAA